MRISDIAKKYNIAARELEKFILNNGIEYFRNPIGNLMEIRNDIVDETVTQFKDYQDYLAYEQTPERVAERKEEEKEKRKAISNMLISSGFSFEGYRITKYSGYISGDDVIQINRGTDLIIEGATDVGDALSKALCKIRRNALAELKEAAYALGCNAIIGVDFDYITLEPETANIMGRTTYLPYVFCVTANGNAVIIEKEN